MLRDAVRRELIRSNSRLHSPRRRVSNTTAKHEVEALGMEASRLRSRPQLAAPAWSNAACSTFSIRINKEQKTVNTCAVWEQRRRRRLSGAERPGRLVLAGHFGLDALTVVVVNHLVGHFCKHALSQSRWRRLRRKKKKKKKKKRQSDWK